MSWDISKSFEFDYGHRVWTQELNEKYSLDKRAACRHLHGHRGKVIVHLESMKLENGMVTDFKHLNIFKRFIDDVIDHKFIFDINDPLTFELFGKDYKSYLKRNYLFADYWSINEDYYNNFEKNYMIELFEGVIFVPFIPTAENFAIWFFKYAQNSIKELSEESKSRFWVKSVEFFETPKSHTMYMI